MASRFFFLYYRLANKWRLNAKHGVLAEVERNLMVRERSHLLLPFASCILSFKCIFVFFSRPCKTKNFVKTKGVGNIEKTHCVAVWAPSRRWCSNSVTLHYVTEAHRAFLLYTTAFNCLSLLRLSLAVHVLLCLQRGGIADKNRGVRECHACLTFAALD